MKNIFTITGLLFISYILHAQTNLINLQQFSTGYYQPLDIENCGDSRLFIAQQPGQIFICDAAGVKKLTPFLDIHDRVDTTFNSQGLLGFAFDPGFTSNGYFYVNYINHTGATQISRFKVSAGNPDIANTASEKFILQIPQPFHYHHGGGMRFGADGYLYIGTGDGDDDNGAPNNYSQNMQSLLGKMLRIDVHTVPYKIPKKNPFINAADTLHEIWASGLRNPWRWSFDALTNNLIIADVGQDTWEEINVQKAKSKGGENFGWHCYEGTDAFNTTNCLAKKKYVFPVAEYGHDESTGDCSVTGGFVYRGTAYTGLYGKYFYADYCSGIIRMFAIDSPANKQNAYYGHSRGYTSFGENKDHELYVSDFSNGSVYRITGIAGLQQKIYNNAANQNIIQKLKVYPNPAKNKFTVSFTATKKEEYALHFYNIVGKEIFVSGNILKQGLNTLNINVPEGVKGNCYFTLSAASGMFISQKILIE